MSIARVEEIQVAIESLPYQEYMRLRQWFSERDWGKWDRQIEADSESGKVEFSEEALDEVFKGFGKTRFPHYCTTPEEAERCADQIAEEHDLQRKTKIDDHTFKYENDKISLTIRIFGDNWHGKRHCYSFEMVSLCRKDIGEEFLAYRGRGHLKRQRWRKVPSYFADDICVSIEALNSVDRSGRVKGEIYVWRESYGFARVGSARGIFVWGGDIPEAMREGVMVGTELRFRVIDDPKGPRATDIAEVGSG